MLIHCALLKIIFEDMLQLNLISYDDLNTLAAFDTSEGVKSIAPISEKVLHALSLLRNTYSDFRTAEYWYQYMEYIDIVKNYIRAERTGDWLLHLASVEKMLNLFAATGHIHYTKSCRLFLQQMSELSSKHPELFKEFTEGGHHCIRRSNRYWAGLWSDLIIEQVMMRSIKSSGGLTRGRGFSESTRNQWVLTAHDFAAVHDALMGLTKTDKVSSEQHKDMSDEIEMTVTLRRYMLCCPTTIPLVKQIRT